MPAPYPPNEFILALFILILEPPTEVYDLPFCIVDCEAGYGLPIGIPESVVNLTPPPRLIPAVFYLD